MKNIKKTVFLAILLAQSLVLHIIEGFIPVPIPAPGVKVGLANIVTMISIVIFGLKETMIIVAMRSFMGGVFSGVLSSFFFSLSGGVLSTIVMYLLYHFYKEYFSLMGISIVGAIFHNIGQLFIASTMVKNFGIFVYLPVLMLSAILTGYFVGLSAQYILKVLTPNLKHIRDLD